MERPLPPDPGPLPPDPGPPAPAIAPNPSRAAAARDLRSLARALLYADATAEAHVAILRAAFPTAKSDQRLLALAHRTLAYTSTRPQPRLGALIRSLQTDGSFQEFTGRHQPHVPPIPLPPRMRPLPGLPPVPPLATTRDLADWLRIDPGLLHWFADLGDLNRRATSTTLRHYNLRTLTKSNQRDGSFRLLESPKQHLKHLQRQIYREILRPIPLHTAVNGFRPGHSILTFAEPHAGRAAVLRFDLQDFFPSVSGPRVQAFFRTLGYPETVADLLGGLCTTTVPRPFWRTVTTDPITQPIDQRQRIQGARILYSRPHLPQGAPTSPAIANLCAFRLDRRLAGLAASAGATYTRYADDLAFSGDSAFARSATLRNFAPQVAAIAIEEGFRVHPHKTRLMRSSARQHLAGLTLNQRPNLSRKDLKQLEAILTNCLRHGPKRKIAPPTPTSRPTSQAA